jgi:Sec7-like guanine-nucleotide exchange factor
MNHSFMRHCSDISCFQKPVAEAMREMLEAFRLPGEAQQISRVAETFAAAYFAARPGMSPSILYFCSAKLDLFFRSRDQK